MRCRHSRGPGRIGRLAREWRLDRNPLRRTTDRAETILIAALLTLILAAAPFAGMLAAHLAEAGSLRQLRTERANFRQVRAVLLHAPVNMLGGFPYGAAMTAEADARWTAPDGQVRSDVVAVPSTAEAGGTVLLWTDQAGNVVTPFQATQIAARSDLASGAAITALVVMFVLAATAVRWTLNKRRLAAWEVGWQKTGPLWTRRPNSDRE